jgi:hypothetical protein
MEFSGPPGKLTPSDQAALTAAVAGASAAATSASAAAISAATAESAAGPTYASTAAGLAATTSGQAFAVDNGDGTVSVYRNNAGVAVLQRKLATTDHVAATYAPKFEPTISGGASFLSSRVGVTDEAVPFTPEAIVHPQEHRVGRDRAELGSILDRLDRLPLREQRLQPVPDP